MLEKLVDAALTVFTYVLVLLSLAFTPVIYAAALVWNYPTASSAVGIAAGSVAAFILLCKILMW